MARSYATESTRHFLSMCQSFPPNAVAIHRAAQRMKVVVATAHQNLQGDQLMSDYEREQAIHYWGYIIATHPDCAAIARARIAQLVATAPTRG
jgi:hypothetical protein